MKRTKQIADYREGDTLKSNRKNPHGEGQSFRIEKEIPIKLKELRLPKTGGFGRSVPKRGVVPKRDVPT
jgi:hypothetical protein